MGLTADIEALSAAVTAAGVRVVVPPTDQTERASILALGSEDTESGPRLSYRVEIASQDVLNSNMLFESAYNAIAGTAGFSAQPDVEVAYDAVPTLGTKPARALTTFTVRGSGIDARGV